MRTITLTTMAATLIAAAAFANVANAGPSFQPINPALQPINKGPIYSPSNPALKPIGLKPIVNPAKNPCVNGGWCDPHHGGGWGHGGFGLQVGLVSAPVAATEDDDCYYVRRRVFVPNYGVVMKRTLVCE